MNAIAHASALSTTGPQLDNRRVLAALIDLMIVGSRHGPDPVCGRRAPEWRRLPGKEVGSGLYLVALAWALYYYFACESGGGQTLGKRVMKLRVVPPTAARPACARSPCARSCAWSTASASTWSA